MPFAVGVRATPRFFSYHSARAFGFFALKKKPPMPATLSIGWEAAACADDNRSAACAPAALMPMLHDAAEYRRYVCIRIGVGEDVWMRTPRPGGQCRRHPVKPASSLIRSPVECLATQPAFTRRIVGSPQRSDHSRGGMSPLLRFERCHRIDG